MKYLYLIMSKTQYDQFRATEKFTSYEQGYGDNFIHLCTEEQIVHVVNKFHKEKSDLIYLPVRYKEVSENIVWEGKGQEFPHLYGDLSYEFVDC